MPGAKSRNKGARVERQAAEAIRRYWLVKAERSARNGVDEAEDLSHALGGIHIEAKGRKQIAAMRFLNQAEEVCGDKVPIALLREDGDTEFAVLLRVKDAVAFSAILMEHMIGLPADPLDETPE